MPLSSGPLISFSAAPLLLLLIVPALLDSKFVDARLHRKTARLDFPSFKKRQAEQSICWSSENPWIEWFNGTDIITPTNPIVLAEAACPAETTVVMYGDSQIDPNGAEATIWIGNWSSLPQSGANIGTPTIAASGTGTPAPVQATGLSNGDGAATSSSSGERSASSKPTSSGGQSSKPSPPPNSPPAPGKAKATPDPNTDTSGDSPSGGGTNTGDTSGSSSGNTGDSSSSGTDTSTGNSNGNLQKFSGAIGGISAPAVTQTSDGKFQTNSNTFQSLAAALDRSCSVQHNQCADQANKTGNKGDLTVANCDKQGSDCQAAAG